MPDGKISYQDLIRDEYKKCLESPVYFMKHYVKIKHPMRGTILFDLFHFQEETLKAFQDYNNTIILKSRQMGISTLVASFSLWLMIFHKDKNVLLISLKQDDAKDVVTKVRDAHRCSPTSSCTTRSIAGWTGSTPIHPSSERVVHEEVGEQ